MRHARHEYERYMGQHHTRCMLHLSSLTLHTSLVPELFRLFSQSHHPFFLLYLFAHGFVPMLLCGRSGSWPRTLPSKWPASIWKARSTPSRPSTCAPRSSRQEGLQKSAGLNYLVTSHSSMCWFFRLRSPLFGTLYIFLVRLTLNRALLQV